MTSVSGVQLPLPGGARALQGNAASAARVSPAPEFPEVSRVARISAGAGQAHAVFSYGHTAQLNHEQRLGTQLDIHV